MNSTNEIKPGVKGIVKVGCNEIKVEVLLVLNNGLLVKNLKTGKTFRTAKLERLLEENAETTLPPAAPESEAANPPATELGGDDGGVGNDGNDDDDDMENPAPEGCNDGGKPIGAVPAKPALPSTPAKPVTKPSTLEEAVKFLRECGESKSCPELIQSLTELGKCSLKGATPAQTLYSSFIREIRDRGENSRMMRDPENKGKFMIRQAAGGQDA